MKESKMVCPETSKTNPVKAIRLKCLDCSGGSSIEVEKCNIPTCALYPFRLGKNPFRTTKEYTEEEKIKLKEQLAKYRKVKEHGLSSNENTLDVGEILQR